MKPPQRIVSLALLAIGWINDRRVFGQLPCRSIWRVHLDLARSLVTRDQDFRSIFDSYIHPHQQSLPVSSYLPHRGILRKYLLFYYYRIRRRRWLSRLPWCGVTLYGTCIVTRIPIRDMEVVLRYVYIEPSQTYEEEKEAEM